MEEDDEEEEVEQDDDDEVEEVAAALADAARSDGEGERTAPVVATAGAVGADADDWRRGVFNMADNPGVLLLTEVEDEELLPLFVRLDEEDEEAW